MNIKELRESIDFIRIAQNNVDNHLGDVVQDPTDAGEIYDSVVALAYDAVVDAGGTHSDARQAAEQISAQYHTNRS